MLFLFLMAGHNDTTVRFFFTFFDFMVNSCEVSSSCKKLLWEEG